MAFFDDLGRKISQAGQSAVQKTKDMTDVARINGAIAEEEKKINNSYFQIGKLYVANHPDDYESEFAGMIGAIRESEIKIRDYRQQVQEIKGVVRCEKCGAEVANNAAFCSSCGAAMPKQTVAADADSIKCIGCGAMVSKNMRFCTSCGKPIADSLQSQPTVQPEPPAPKKCPGCGAEVEEGMSFCSFCGTAIDKQVVVTEESTARKCPNCNFEVEEGLAFCTECGTKL